MKRLVQKILVIQHVSFLFVGVVIRIRVLLVTHICLARIVVQSDTLI